VFRRRAQQLDMPDLAMQQGLPAQQVWSAGLKELDAAMAMLLELEAAIREGRTLDADAQFEFLKHLTNAEFSFEILVEREANLEIVKPLALGCRKLAEGLLNGDGDVVFEARKLIVDTMLPIEEERERRRQSGE
jgi:hypothetical protein